jgi:hypothetical protein
MSEYQNLEPWKRRIHRHPSLISKVIMLAIVLADQHLQAQASRLAMVQSVNLADQVRTCTEPYVWIQVQIYN